MTEIISGEVVESRILLIRGKKVMIDRDLQGYMRWKQRH